MAIRREQNSTGRTWRSDNTLRCPCVALHWGEIGTPLEFERGEWQISRVYAVLNRPAAAIHHAHRCLALCEANQIGDFDLAFAYEALARATAVAGEAARSREYVSLAEQAASGIEDQDNREYFLSELGTVSELLE
jgi:hypothetical protein